MANFDFSIFDEQYPIIIRQMPPVFGSHQFILELAQQNQAMYVRALYEYRDSVHVETPSPFQFVHSALAAKLKDFPELVELVRTDKPSIDIFGTSSYCSEWRKVN